MSLRYNYFAMTALRLEPLVSMSLIDHNDTPIWFASYGWAILLKNFFALAIAMSVERLVEASITFSLIHFGSLFRLSARAKRCLIQSRSVLS